MAMPIGYLLDLIAIEQIKNEGATLKKSGDEEADEFMRLLEYKWLERGYPALFYNLKNKEVE